MQKLGYELVLKFGDCGITSNEFDILIYISQFQNEFGKVIGVHYRDVCENLKISVQGFYDALDGLEKKKLILAERKNCDYDIIILGNNKVESENWKSGYLPLSKCPVLFTDEFRKLPVKAKILLLHLIRNELIRRKNVKSKKSVSMQRIKKDFLEKFSEILKVAQRTIKQYLTYLKPFISVYLENGRKYFFTLNKNCFSDRIGCKSENEILRENQTKTAIRRSRIKATGKENNLIKKLSFYHRFIVEAPDFDFSQIVENAIRRKNKTKNKYKMKRHIDLNIIEDCLCEALKIERKKFAQSLDGQTTYFYY